MNQIDVYYKVKKSDVSFVCAYLEAFEGMAAVRTPDPKFGEDAVLHFMVAPDLNEQFETLIADLGKEVPMERTEP